MNFLSVTRRSPCSPYGELASWRCMQACLGLYEQPRGPRPTIQVGLLLFILALSCCIAIIQGPHAAYVNANSGLCNVLGPGKMVASNRARRTQHQLSSFYYMLILSQCIVWLPRATLQAPATSAKYGFVYVGTAASWTAAEADCVTRGGHLASISTAADNQQVQTLCSQKLPYAQLNSPANSGCWIGLNDQATEATYVWTDGTPFSYTAWHQGPNLPQPDDNKQTQYVEDCVLFVVDNVYLGWHDWGCADRQSYVCKVLISQSPSPSPAANITQPSPSVASPSPAPVVVAPPAANGTSSSSSNSSTSGTAVTGSTSPPSTTSTGTGSPATATASTPAGGSVTTASDTVTPGQFVTGTVPSISTTTPAPSSTASSLTSAASTVNNNNQSATASSTGSGGDGSDKWKLVVSIVIPVLTGLAALITIAYTGWKWWHKRQATLARRRGMGLVPHASAVKPLIAVNV